MENYSLGALSPMQGLLSLYKTQQMLPLISGCLSKKLTSVRKKEKGPEEDSSSSSEHSKVLYDLLLFPENCFV